MMNVNGSIKHIGHSCILRLSKQYVRLVHKLCENFQKREQETLSIMIQFFQIDLFLNTKSAKVV